MIIDPLTRFSPKWVKIWLAPVCLSCILWLIGRFMPWENIYLYPIQAVLLTLPVWIMAVWLPWTIACVLWWKKRWWLVVVSLIGLGWPFSSTDPDDGFDVLVANVNAFSGRAQFLQSYIELMHVDVAVLVEKRAVEINGMIRQADDFSLPVARPSHHIAVFCREDCSAWVSGQIGSPDMAMSLALVRLPSEVCLIAIHAPPPVPKSATGMRPYIEFIEKYVSQGRLVADWEVCQQNDKVIIAGDMNAVAGSWPYRSLINTGIKDLRSYRGILGATWPTGSEAFIDFPFFRIDHILTKDVDVYNISTIDIPDSDHKGILFSVR
jgi:endonuclease/exonuclease/phosphatase (EEP) superfamily protein YafD